MSAPCPGGVSLIILASLPAMVLAQVPADSASARADTVIAAFRRDRVEAADVRVPPLDALWLLGGRIPGASVTAAGGGPGTAPDVRLRRPGTSAEEPLYIVDGVVASNGLVGSRGDAVLRSRARRAAVHDDDRLGGGGRAREQLARGHDRDARGARQQSAPEPDGAGRGDRVPVATLARNHPRPGTSGDQVGRPDPHRGRPRGAAGTVPRVREPLPARPGRGTALPRPATSATPAA